MAELISRCFEALIFEVNALPIPREYKDAMIGKLDYLRTQSLCDFDRRHSTSKLREVWKEVDRDMATHGLYERYKPSRRVWDNIGMFVEVGQFKPVALKAVKAPSPYQDATVVEILQAMQKEAAGVPTIKLKLQLKAGLGFLIEEAKKNSNARNHSAIITTWKDLHPDLKKSAILQPFEVEPVKSRILDFLRS